jgi:2-dehydro-3-deoxygluconokinase
LGQVAERIGSGDAFMGGLIYAMVEHMSDSEAIELAVAAGALKHSVVGDLALISLNEIKSLMKNGSTFGKISR